VTFALELDSGTESRGRNLSIQDATSNRPSWCSFDHWRWTPDPLWFVHRPTGYGLSTLLGLSDFSSTPQRASPIVPDRREPRSGLQNRRAGESSQAGSLLRAVKAAKTLVTTHKLGYTLLIAVAVVVGFGLLVATLEESSPERNIQSIPDGLWWAVTTMTTVGFGDRFPVTAAGRAIGAGIMILGIGLFGLLAAPWHRSSSRRTSRRTRSTHRSQRWPRGWNGWSRF
jgi:Ion channel